MVPLLFNNSSNTSSSTKFNISSISDTLNNTWVNIPVDTTPGNYGVGYALGSSAGGDTVTAVGSGFCGFTYDPCIMAAEIAGIASFGGLSTFTGTDSVASGSVTTPEGTYTFATATSYNAWVLSLLYFVGINPGTGMILAVPYAPLVNFDEDTISGWELQCSNLHSGLYTISVTPTPPAPVRMFVNTGPTKHGW